MNSFQNKRLTNFDFLKGFVVFLALMEHFADSLNYWYIWPRQNYQHAESSLFSFHQQFIGEPISTDGLGVFLCWFFIPWVSQIYLCLAAFALAKQSQVVFKKTYRKKLYLYSWLFILFLAENAFVSENSGVMFSFYPLLAWMVILITLTLMYRFLGIRWIALFYVLSLFHPLTNIDLFFDQIEQFIQSNFHADFEYDARIHYFFSSGSLGFILGYIHYQLKGFNQIENIHSKKVTMGLLTIAFLMYSIWWIFGSSFLVDPTDVLRHEHDFNLSVTGILFNQSVQIFLLTTLLILHFKNIHIPGRFFIWIGINSLLVFFTHRLFFLEIIGPIREIVGGIMHWKMTAYALEVIFYCLLSIAMSYAVTKSPLPLLLFGRSSSKTDRQ